MNERTFIPIALVAPFTLFAFGVSLGQSREVDDYAVLRASQERFRAVAAKLRPSLVRIETVGGAQPAAPAPQETKKAPGPNEEGPFTPPKRLQNPFRDDPGSGFVVADGPTTGLVYSADGYIVTSSFNFVREPELISVTLADGRRVAADLIARDQVRKIALLKIDASGLPVPEWRAVDAVQVGQSAIALGLGFGGSDPSITVGIVSALNRMRGNAIQTDAKLNPANYGGPVCDIEGRVIGICVPMAQRAGELAGVELYDAGVGFAVPKHRLDAIVKTLMTGASVYRGWLGFVIDPRVPDAVVIRNIAEPSPAQEAGLRPGDKIVGADGQPIRHFGQLVQAIYMIPAGEMVFLRIERDGAEFTAAATLARSSDLGPLPALSEPFDPAAPPPPPPDGQEEP